MKTHLVIPDTQVCPGSPTEHLTWIGEYIVHKEPDVIVMLGDFAEMESLSSYDRGKKAFEGRRYWKDVEAAKQAMGKLLSPLRREQQKRKYAKRRQYMPRMVMLLGNHENRINRAVEQELSLKELYQPKTWDMKQQGGRCCPFWKWLRLTAYYILISSLGMLMAVFYRVHGVVLRPLLRFVVRCKAAQADTFRDFHTPFTRRIKGDTKD
jgi:hypothetical protein